ncbi:hypothetical protein CRI94_02295 [Longibacter salinarum]|uniref:Uncharacterized protein n=1 Tax=Longibacter salinarum TaxID=1850348 RepID=A0A2A8D2U3_9BACT|nr:hypothetical protein [Longibacter salinarum]PEN15137.1 hypothetical protein CRI94_02295 [Longibacter salinarum]
MSGNHPADLNEEAEQNDERDTLDRIETDTDRDERPDRDGTRETGTPGGDGTGAHTCVPPSGGWNWSDGYELPKQPQKADLEPHPVVWDLRQQLTKIEAGDPANPGEAVSPTASTILKVINRSFSRPEGAMDFRFIRVSAHEVDLVEKWRPILAEHDGLRGMAQLIIHRKRDEKNADKDYIPVPRDSIRGAFGLRPQKSGDQTQALLLLWTYRALVDSKLEWSDYADGHCRRITNHGTPEEIMDEATSFFLDRQGKKSVLFMKGDVSRPTKVDFRQDCFEKLDGKRRRADDAEVTPPGESQRIIKYLNNLTRDARSPGRDVYTELAHNVQNGVDALMEAAERGSEVYNKGIRQSITNLRRFQDMPFMLYQAGNRTPRPTPVGANHLVGVDSKAIPPMLGDRHVALDLSKAQLAMFARVAEGEYDVDMSTTSQALASHLDDSEDFDMWESMREALDMQAGEAEEYAVKRGTYSAVYGASENTIMHNASKEIAERTRYDYPDREKVNGLLDHPVIEEVLTAREEAYEQIKQHERDGDYTTDAFGRVLDRNTFVDADDSELSGEQPEISKAKRGEITDKAARSLLSYIVQSVEVKTMWPVFEAAIEERQRDGEDRWRVMLYKYDEVILWVRYEQQVETYANHATSLVRDHADKYDIQTRLDVEYTPV